MSNNEFAIPPALYALEGIGARVAISSGNEYNLQVTTWPYFTAGGHIRFQGDLKSGQVTLYHVTDKATRDEARHRIAKFIEEFMKGLTALDLAMGRIVQV
jgi:hypothetical protein